MWAERLGRSSVKVFFFFFNQKVLDLRAELEKPEVALENQKEHPFQRQPIAVG